MSLDGGEEGPPPNPHAEDMTLRDYFAAQVIPTVIATPRGLTAPLAMAQVAYQLADAMLAARVMKP